MEGPARQGTCISKSDCGVDRSQAGDRVGRAGARADDFCVSGFRAWSCSSDSMTKISFYVEANRQPCVSSLCFATKAELNRYHASLRGASGKSSRLIKDAIEFSRLAAKRWRY